MRTTLYNTTYKHVGALENNTKSNITKLLTELKTAIEVMKRTNVTISFANIRISRST